MGSGPSDKIDVVGYKNATYVLWALRIDQDTRWSELPCRTCSAGKSPCKRRKKWDIPSAKQCLFDTATMQYQNSVRLPSNLTSWVTGHVFLACIPSFAPCTVTPGIYGGSCHVTSLSNAIHTQKNAECSSRADSASWGSCSKGIQCPSSQLHPWSPYLRNFKHHIRFLLCDRLKKQPQREHN